jgi:16S rRNA (guanine527-N7)-methyltransferase
LRTAQVSLRAPAGWKRPVLERARGEEILAKKIHFDVAIARATLPPPAWVELGAKLADEVWVLLAKDEAPPAPTGFSQGETLAYEWPLTGAKRRAIVYRKDR